LVRSAPIAAVCYCANQTADVEDLRIRIYTILNQTPTSIIELARDGEQWQDVIEIANIAASAGNRGGIAQHL
jgi:hypothetical protein